MRTRLGIFALTAIESVATQVESLHRQHMIHNGPRIWIPRSTCGTRCWNWTRSMKTPAFTAHRRLN